MAKTDRAAFAGVLRDAETVMDALFQRLAQDVGSLVLRAQGPDGTVPIERLPELRRQAGRLVDAVFLSADRRAFDDENRPLAPYPELITDGQMAMIDLALERAAAIWKGYAPEDLRQELARAWLSRKVVRS